MEFLSPAGICKMLVGIANREEPDQTASSEVCAACLGRQLVFKILEHLPYATNLMILKIFQGIPITLNYRSCHDR